MLRTGVIGGHLGTSILRRIGAQVARGEDPCSGSVYQGRSKLEMLIGPQVWREVVGKVVIDFGCGTGEDAVEMAQRGAKKVIGIDLRQKVLDCATWAARRAGVSDRCIFTTHTDEKADVILSLDGFEHYDDPEGVLKTMRELLRDSGRGCDRVVGSGGGEDRAAWCRRS